MDLIDLRIERMNFRGEGLGVGKDGGKYRVANAVEGERVLALDASAPRRRLAFLADIPEPASGVVTPFCPYWRECAACQYTRLTAEAQAALKQSQWLRLIGRFVSLDAADVQFVPAAQHTAYRHRTHARWADGRFIMPLRLDAQTALERNTGKRDDIPFLPSCDAIPLHECRLHADCLNRFLHAVEAAMPQDGTPDRCEYELEAFEDNARITLQARPDAVSDASRLARVLASAAHDILPSGAMTVVLQPLPPHGSHVYPPTQAFSPSPFYTYARDLNGHPLDALKGAWTPANPQNAALIRTALTKMLTAGTRPVGRVLELGCGCGTHAALFDAFDYHGIDASWPAIQSAQHNAEINHWTRKTFQTSTALHYLEKNYYRGHRADLVLMHSNRLPYDADVAEYCKKFGAHTILIVAPTAFAIAAECQHFCNLGYQLQQLILCDTMPYTYHMMASARLSISS